MDLARKKKIVLEDEKASANQVSITFGSFSLDELCSLKRIKNEELLVDNKVRDDQLDDDEGEEKSDDLPLEPSPKKLIESTPQEVNACEEKVTFTNDDLLLGDTLHNRMLYLSYNDPRIQPMGEKVIRLEITIEDMQSSAWLHVIDTKTSYNVLLGRPWTHENKVVPSTYHQCLKYYEGEVEKKIVANDEPFIEAESHFTDAKFYLKNCIMKEIKVDDGMKSKNDEPITKRAEVTIGKAKAITEEAHANVNKSHKEGIASYGKKVSLALQYVPKRKKYEGESSNFQTKTLRELTLLVKRIEAVKLSSKPLAGFVAQNRLQNMALHTKRTDEGFDPNAYKLFAKVRYNPNEPSKLGKLPSETSMRQPHEATNKSHGYVDEVLKVKPYTAVYTKEHDEDEESMGSSYHVTAQGQHGVLSLMEDDEKLDDVSLCYHISFNDGDPQEDEDAKDAPPKLEEGVNATIDTLIEVNLGTDEEPRPTYLSALLEVYEESTYIELLKEFRDVFAWSYKEMLGLDPKVVVHHLAVKNGARPVKQAQRCFRPDLVPLIEIEVNKLIKAGFIREVKYPTWVSTIVPIRKKNGQIPVCVDFRDLNNACPKYESPLPIPEQMIDTTTGYEVMSFMNGSSGYNQIYMAPKDEELIAFRTPKGIYCYKVMPFGLKNAGATYQRAMQNNFDDLLHKNVKCYMDDLVVKSERGATT
ncbi:uncharacterized protein [Nicotiana sylvestris]|uniref:uncharacterized protein n=1 Tax=Nicotiana sylvestris TaxID=4096 RepID=UPI00388C4D3B